MVSSQDQHPRGVPAPLAKRSCGLLLHVTSLPSKWGVGDLGEVAFRLVDRLAEAGIALWQVLPLNPTTPIAADSPYFSSSAFAGNALLIDPAGLVADGLLEENELPEPLSCGPTVDFEAARARKVPLLDRAVDRFIAAAPPRAYAAFCADNAHWLDDYVDFLALRSRLGGSWVDWPREFRDRDSEALARARRELAAVREREKVLQFLFYEQLARLKRYANRRGVHLFGDMPIYVSRESADVWGHPEIFQLSEEKLPLQVSGVPPDYFSATGQLWNNPVYDWDALLASDFSWWLRRIEKAAHCFDVLRIDHFRGLVQYWSVPAGSETAIDGSWRDVPGYQLFDRVLERLPGFPIVAEDLGLIFDDVVALKEHYRFPGMLVMHFAFGDGDDNPYLPCNHVEDAVVYLGTHDNNTTRGWLDAADERLEQRIRAHLPTPPPGPITPWTLIDLALASRARTAIITAQDLLELPADARMNDPSLPGDNWRWRLTWAQFEALPLERLGELSRHHGRATGAA